VKVWTGFNWLRIRSSPHLLSPTSFLPPPPSSSCVSYFYFSPPSFSCSSSSLLFVTSSAPTPLFSLGVVYALALAKNTLWALHVRLSVAFLIILLQMTLDHIVTMVLDITVASDTNVEFVISLLTSFPAM
jgi:hypothetical protein